MEYPTVNRFFGRQNIQNLSRYRKMPYIVTVVGFHSLCHRVPKFTPREPRSPAQQKADWTEGVPAQREVLLSLKGETPLQKPRPRRRAPCPQPGGRCAAPPLGVAHGGAAARRRGARRCTKGAAPLLRPSPSWLAASLGAGRGGAAALRRGLTFGRPPSVRMRLVL